MRLGSDQSRFDLALAGGTISEVRNIASGSPAGFWIGSDGNVHKMTHPNTITSAVWFYPALVFFQNSPNTSVAASYVDQEVLERNHRSSLACSLLNMDQRYTNAAVASLSATDIYLDPTSALPIAMVFNAHPDTISGINIPVEIDYSAYTVVNGFQVPFHIQKLLNGNLLVDITVQSAKVNSGLSASDFSL